MPRWDANPRADVVGRERRFRAIYDADFAAVLGFTLRRTAGAEDAADVAAETFLVARRRLDDVPPLGQSRLWLYAVARKVLANHRRGERRRSALGELLARDLADIWEDPPPSDVQPLAMAWTALRETDREILDLAAWEGLSGDQLAAVVGCSRTTAKLRLHRARRRFAKEPRRAGLERKLLETSGHVQGGRASARPGTEET